LGQYSIRYGAAQFYFKGDYTSNPGKSRVLPAPLDRIDYGFARLDDLYSNFKIECDTPVRGQIHVFDEIYESPLNKNARYKFFVGSQYYEYQLPRERPLTISAYTPYTIDIYISFDSQEQTYTIEKGKPLIVILDTIKGNNKISFYSMKDSYFEITIISTYNQFDEIVAGTYSQMTSKNLVAFLPTDSIKQRYTSYEVKLSNVKNDFIYTFMRVDLNDKMLVPLPSLSGYSDNIVKADYLRRNEFRAFESGAFDKKNPELGSYAFVFEFLTNNTSNEINSFNKGEFYPYKVEFIIHERKEYPQVKRKEFGHISEKNNSFAEQIIEIEDCSDYHENYVLFTFKKSGETSQNIYLNNFESNIISLNCEDKYSSFFMKNPQLFMQIETSTSGFEETELYSGITFSYQFVDTIDKKYLELIKSFNEEKEPKVVYAGSSYLSWKPLDTQYPVKYHIYLFEEGKVSGERLKNEMFVSAAKKNNLPEFKKYDTSSTESYKISESGKFDAVVIAEVQGPTPIRYMYQYTNINTGGLLSKLWWIILICIIGVAAIVAGIIYFVMQNKKRQVVLPSNYDPLMGSSAVN
jgi:hypothetical protein